VRSLRTVKCYNIFCFAIFVDVRGVSVESRVFHTKFFSVAGDVCNAIKIRNAGGKDAAKYKAVALRKREA
jgi:hypothetical protein